MSAPPRARQTDLALAAASVASAVLLFVALSGRRDNAAPLAFIGRFHPLAVHLPIGICLLVGVLEALTISAALRRRIDPALAIIHRLALASALAAFALGLLLASAGGHAERLLRLHERLALGTVVASAVSLLTWSLHVRQRVPRLAHRVAVTFMLMLLGISAHFGGSMTHGESYLGKDAPAFIRSRIDGARAKSDASPFPPKET